MEFNVGDIVTIKPEEAESISEDTGLPLQVLGGQLKVFEVSTMFGDDYPFLVGETEETAVWMAEGEIVLADVNKDVQFTEEEVQAMLAANPYALPLE